MGPLAATDSALLGVRTWRARVAILSLFLVTVGLGTWGYAARGYGPVDSVYAALQLFGLNQDGVTADENGALEVARFFAPVLTVTALAAAIAVLFSDRIRAFVARRSRDHVVVCGLGTRGYAAARALRDAGRRVVAVEQDPVHPHIAPAKAHGILAITGDATDASFLRRAGVPRASLVVIHCGEDTVNVDAALTAQVVCRTAKRGRPHVVAHLDDFRLWAHLQAYTMATDVTAHIRLDFFNAEDTAARVLLGKHPPERDGAGGRVLLVGFDSVAARLVLQLAQRRAAGAGPRPQVTVVAPGAHDELARLERANPGLAEACLLDPVDAYLADPGTPEQLAVDATGDLDPVTIAYVCTGDPAAAFAAALALRPLAESRQFPVVLTVQDESRGIPEPVIRSEFPSLRVFGVLTQALTPDALTSGGSELLARAKHEHYVAEETAAGVRPEDNPSLAPWEQLPDSLKDSNRRFASRVAPKLDEFGYLLVPARLDDTEILEFTDREVEALARMEHDGWCEDLRRDGWKPGPVKDANARVHPMLVGWEDLPESEREKDRAPVRALPPFLLAAGHRVIRASDVRSVPAARL